MAVEGEFTTVQRLNISTMSLANLAIAVLATHATPIVRVVANEYAFQLPKSVPTGLVDIRLVNRGKEVHFLRLTRLPDGKTMAEYNAARVGKTPFRVEPIASPTVLLPGDSTDMLLSLRPGRYVAICMYPSPTGVPHGDLGMIAELTVDSAVVRDVSEPETDATLRLDEYAMALTAPLTTASHALRIENIGSATHSAYILRVPPGSTAREEVEIFKKGPYNERASRPIQGLTEIGAGVHAITTISLEPGDYVIICGNYDRQGRHMDRGMVLPFTVN